MRFLHLVHLNEIYLNKLTRILDPPDPPTSPPVALRGQGGFRNRPISIRCFWPHEKILFLAEVITAWRSEIQCNCMVVRANVDDTPATHLRKLKNFDCFRLSLITFKFQTIKMRRKYDVLSIKFNECPKAFCKITRTLHHTL